jgi:fermentation-respiration switch protein FrsA (DUF1100 family)
MENVCFPSEGLNCAADLYLPEAEAAGPLPAIVLGHGFAINKPLLADQGRAFADAGFAALAIDYRYWGESEGEPRRRNFPMDKAEDYRNAVSYLQTRPDIDPARIGVWGTSFSGGTVLHVAAVDRRVKATVAQVPVTDGREWLRMMRNPSQWEELLTRIEEDRLARYRGEAGATIPDAGRSGEWAVLPWKGEGDESMASPDEMTLESVERVIEWRPTTFIEEIAPRPLMIITATGYDVIHPYWMAADAYARAREPKELVRLPFPGMAVYGQPALRVALAHAVRFFREHLGETLTDRQRREIEAAGEREEVCGAA